MFSEDQRFWILAHVFKDLGFLDFGSYFQRPRILGLGSCFSGPKVLDPGSCFQRPRIFGFWLMPMCVAFHTSTCKINIFN